MLRAVLKTLLKRAEPPARARFADAFRLYTEGRLDEAACACEVVVDVPRADVDFLAGLIAQARGDFAAAAECFAAAVRGRDGEASFHHGLAEALAKLGRYDDATHHYERFSASAVAEDPRRVDACLAAADCQEQLGSDANAARWYERAIDAATSDEAASTKIAFALYWAGRIEQARAAQLRSRGARRPLTLRLRRALMLPALYTSRDEIDAVRARFAQELDELAGAAREPVPDPDAAVGVMPFYMAYHNLPNRDLLRKVCAAARRVYDASGEAAPEAHPRGTGRLRIGFVSTFFHGHSAGRVTHGLFRDLPRDRFEVYVFAIEPVDDPVRQEMARSADHYRALPRALEEVRRTIAEARLDVLVFADIGMHPTTYFLALCRLAPVQVAWWGHSETSGVDTIDYYLSADGIETASAQEHYSETLVRPDAFFLPGFARPALEAPPTRDALGLPSERPLYACLQILFKMHPDMDAVFAAILERDPRGEILLLDSRAAWREQLRRRFARTIGADGSRIRFLPGMPHQRYLATMAAADVVLDPLYFGGCNSSCEALAVGAPVVTLPGSRLFGRFTLGLYREMGLTDCVVDSVEAYADLAVRIATDPGYRSDLSREIGRRSGILFERKDITLAFADFAERAVRGEVRPLARGGA